jgi:hypothetical protein
VARAQEGQRAYLAARNASLACVLAKTWLVALRILPAVWNILLAGAFKTQMTPEKNLKKLLARLAWIGLMINLVWLILLIFKILK